MKVKLRDVSNIIMGQSPDSSTYNTEKIGLPFFQGNADFGELNPIAKTWCSAPIKIAYKNYILISVRAPIGALNIAAETCCIGRGLAAFDVNNKMCTQKYLWYLLKAKKNELLSKGTGSTFKAISKNILSEMEFNIPPVREQELCTKVLDVVFCLIRLKKEQLDKLDLLVKSRFIEMFGDPVSNPKGWILKKLSDLGQFKNGINFHFDDAGIEIYCLGVGNFKNNDVLNNMKELSLISLSNLPSEEYFLHDNDIVFVRSNGNKALVGRCLAVYPGEVPVIFSGFCIRFRKNNDSILIPYLLHILKCESVRRKLTGRGANIQNLNQQILGNLIIPLPPLELQNRFATFVIETNKSKLAIQQSLDELETLKKSLMQQYFG